MREREVLLGAGHADVREAPLLLDPLLLDRAGVGEDALLHPDHEHGAELSPLALWRVISVTRLCSSRIVSWSEKSEICWRNSDRVGSSACSAYSCATPTSSCRFSIRPRASIVRSASS